MRCMCCDAYFKARTKQQIFANEISEYLCDLCLDDVTDTAKIDYVNPFVSDFEHELNLLLYKDGRTAPRFSD